MYFSDKFQDCPMKIRSGLRHRAALWCAQQLHCDIVELNFCYIWMFFNLLSQLTYTHDVSTLRCTPSAGYWRSAEWQVCMKIVFHKVWLAVVWRAYGSIQCSVSEPVLKRVTETLIQNTEKKAWMFCNLDMLVTLHNFVPRFCVKSLANCIYSIPEKAHVIVSVTLQSSI